MAERASDDLYDERGEAAAVRSGVYGAQKVQLRAERLAVDTVRVASGAVRIRKKVVSERRSIDVPVAHEELVVERYRVTSGALGGTLGATETILIPLAREDVRIGMETFVTEEIEIGKRVVTATERVSETLRHEELIVERDGSRELRATNLRAE